MGGVGGSRCGPGGARRLSEELSTPGHVSEYVCFQVHGGNPRSFSGVFTEKGVQIPVHKRVYPSMKICLPLSDKA